MIAYHITEKRNLASIQEKGLVPSVGPRSKDLGEPENVVYFFRSLEDVDNALLNWLGEWYEDYEDEIDLVILEVNLHGFEFTQEAFEYQVRETISPDRIQQIIEEENLHKHLKK